ncbi:hypothetical protein bas09_0058 [Changchunvirus paulsarasin]|uniref:Uncharacterized protein n=2 Tax=Changchunvirus TaxID=2842593 RepID=A0AAE7VY77_9CAUD|nr:hypothetical protein KMB85_gp41 [Escherichia phage vB_EcoS_W011D]QCW18488.1 hypothetical protein vBEcoSW011D_41 [Escherichia phage vB_EcoS_W011D]QXV83703.1 hypothetical protein bas09_0058 [Escherichia phage PaulSarasin]
MTFTKEQFSEFFRLVQMSGSCNQMDRINSRLDMPKFIKEHGRDKCNEMWRLIESGVTPSTLEIG